jgi:hypothetical protein
VSWLLHVLGVDNVAGRWYAFWSGFGSDLGEAAIVGVVAGILRKHNCEVRGCWRLGRHLTSAGHHVCRRHHPDEQLTQQDVLDAHQERGTRHE